MRQFAATLIVMMLGASVPVGAQTGAAEAAEGTAETEEVQAPSGETEPTEVDEVQAPSGETEPTEAAGAAEGAAEAEEAALEADMAEAKESVEQIRAATVAESNDVTVEVPEVEEEAKDEERERPAFGGKVIFEHAVGTGTFVENDFVREQSDYFVQTWDVRPTYRFDILGHKLSTWARFIMDIELTEPNTVPARRFVPYDLSLYLSDASIWTEPVTGINFSGHFRYYFPTSWESAYVTKRWGAAQIYLGVDRSLGPVDLSYTYGFRKNFNSSKVSVKRADLARPNDPIKSSDSGSFLVESGAPNISFDMLHSFDVTFNILPTLYVGYTLAIINYWKYNVFQSNDDITAELADAGRQRGLDYLWPTLEVGYKVSEAVGGTGEGAWPVDFTVALGITSLHPAQTADNKEILWPVFWNTFGDNRAANNYGSIYLDLVGTY